MKQTAVEWLHSEYKRILGDVLVKASQGIEIADALEQAKEIENKNINDRINAIYEVILQLHNNEEITGFSKRAYAQCLDIVEQFKNK